MFSSEVIGGKASLVVGAGGSKRKSLICNKIRLSKSWHISDMLEEQSCCVGLCLSVLFLRQIPLGSPNDHEHTAVLLLSLLRAETIRSMSHHVVIISLKSSEKQKIREKIWCWVSSSHLPLPLSFSLLWFFEMFHCVAPLAALELAL